MSGIDYRQWAKDIIEEVEVQKARNKENEEIYRDIGAMLWMFETEYASENVVIDVNQSILEEKRIIGEKFKDMDEEERKQFLEERAKYYGRLTEIIMLEKLEEGFGVEK